MRTPGGQGAQRDVAKQLKVLMPSCFHKLRISDELAGHLDAGNGGSGTPPPTALVVNSFGKVWHVEVSRDSGGAFLGRGWPEFVDANGFGVGWFLVLRHEGRGVLTVKPFDPTCCLQESATATRSNMYGSHKPQFIMVLLPDFMEKMLIPPTFVQRYVSEAQQSSKMAIIASQFGKFWPIEVEKDGIGMILAGGWSQFLAFHGISKGDVVLLRYEGNMVFKIKVFGLNGCQKSLKSQGVRNQQNTETQKEAHSSSRTRKRKNERSSGKEDTRHKGSVSSSSKGSQKKRILCSFQIGKRSWIKKEMNTYSLKRYLCLGVPFCNSIGFVGDCTITLKTAMNSNKCWQVRGLGYKKHRYLCGKSWRSFCKENKIREGDVCTFQIVENTVWHVDITRCSDRSR